MTRRQGRSRKTTTGRPGRPKIADAYRDAVLRDHILKLYEELGGKAEAPRLYEVACKRGIFPTTVMARFARRAGIEFIRSTLGQNDPKTGLPIAQPVPIGRGQQLWIKLVLMTAHEYSAMLRQRSKQLDADYGELRRLFEYGVARFGRPAMPEIPQLTIPPPQ